MSPEQLLHIMKNARGPDRSMTGREVINASFRTYGQAPTLRELAHLIRKCRLHNRMPICAHASGYYLATTKAELEEAVEFLHKRGRRILSAAQSLRNTEPIPSERLEQLPLIAR